MEEQKDKRVLKVELNDEVKKVSITGTDSDEKVVMHQELNEKDLEQAIGGDAASNKIPEILKKEKGEYLIQHPELQIFL
jgi:asparagine synthetase A